MELPYHLKALPSEALDVLRYFSQRDEPAAQALVISDEVGLSDRTFGKVIRRLVTKGYLQMDGEQAYRLTERGRGAVEDLIAYEKAAPPGRREYQAVLDEVVTRHLTLVTPRPLHAGMPTDVFIGISPARKMEELDRPLDVVVRLTLLNAQPARPQEISFVLGSAAAQQSFKVTAGLYEKVRFRAQVYQLGPNPDDVNVAGGLYVDVDVTPANDPAPPVLAAYGTDLKFTV